jgi:hypothetical protein
VRRDAEGWARRFGLGAWANGLLRGALSLVLVTEADTATHLLAAAVGSGLLSAAAVRNSPVPCSAQGTILLALLPVIGACLANRRGFDAALEAA